MKLTILALDPAVHCGFAHQCGISGTWDLTVRRDESAGMRLIRLRGKLNEVLKNAPFNLLVFEAARHAAPGQQGALVVQAELQGVVKAWCHDNHIEYRGYSPSEVKKHATGKGNASKEAMIDFAKVKWGRTVKIVDDNHADALWILDLAKKTLT